MKRALFLILTLTLIVACAVSCKPTSQPDQTTAPETTEAPQATNLTVAEDGKFNFVVTRPYKTDNVKMYTGFVKDLKSAT